MIRFIIVLTVLLQVALVAPGHAFLDYLFSGKQSRDAIDNNVVGDLRSWWTGNPNYLFNPYYQPNQINPQGQQQGGFPGGAAPQAQAPQPQPPVVNYYPPQQGVPGSYGQIVPQGAQPGYGPPAGNVQQYQMQPGVQQYQAPAQNYQYAPQAAYQPPPQQMMYQYSPQGYQGPPAAYQGTAPAGAYQGMVPGGQ